VIKEGIKTKAQEFLPHKNGWAAGWAAGGSGRPAQPEVLRRARVW